MANPLENPNLRQDEPDFDPTLPEPPPPEEIVEEPADQQPPGRSISEDIKQVRDTAKDIKEGLERRASKAAEKSGLKGVEKQAAQSAKSATGKVAGQAAKGVAEAGVKTVAVEGAEVAAATGVKVVAAGAVEALSGPVGWVIAGLSLLKPLWRLTKKAAPTLILIIGFMLFLPAIAFTLIFTNTGLGIKATNANQQQSITLVKAASGDIFARQKITKEEIDFERARYQRILKQAKVTSGSVPASTTESRINDLNKQLDALTLVIGGRDTTKANQLRQTIRDADKTMEKDLPFGQWIATIAKSKKDQKSGTFCTITGATPTLACASVVWTILYEAGVPQAPCPTTMCVWDNDRLGTVVNPVSHPTLDKTLYGQNKDKLQPGDIVWWGNGVRNGQQLAYDHPGSSPVLFNHIGVYVGDGQAVDNSSSDLRVEQRNVDRSSVFNGAKRYSP
jgi:hypothetical protein